MNSKKKTVNVIVWINKIHITYVFRISAVWSEERYPLQRLFLISYIWYIESTVCGKVYRGKKVYSEFPKLLKQQN